MTQPRAYRVEVYGFDVPYGVENPKFVRVLAWDAADAVTQVSLPLGKRAKVMSVAPWVDEEPAP